MTKSSKNRNHCKNYTSAEVFGMKVNASNTTEVVNAKKSKIMLELRGKSVQVQKFDVWSISLQKRIILELK